MKTAKQGATKVSLCLAQDSIPQEDEKLDGQTDNMSSHGRDDPPRSRREKRARSPSPPTDHDGEPMTTGEEPVPTGLVQVTREESDGEPMDESDDDVS